MQRFFSTANYDMTSTDNSRSRFCEYFDDVSTCMICLSRLDDPYLCPYCSKLYCYTCILKWLEAERHLNCPHCNRVVQLEKLVKVRWFQEMERLQRSCCDEPKPSSADVRNNETCPKHMQTVNLYCRQCEVCICNECAVNDHIHWDHTFKSMEVIYNSDRQIVKREIEKTTQNLKKIALTVKKTNQSMELVEVLKAETVSAIRLFADKAIREVEAQAGRKLCEIQKHKTSLLDIVHSVERIKTKVAGCTKTQLISEETILKKCSEIQMNSKKQIEHKQASETPILSMISGVFVIENFSSLLHSRKTVKSDFFADKNYHIWRVLVSIGSITQQLEIYLELVDGSSCWVECCLQLYHTRVEKMVEGEFKGYYDHPKSKQRGLRKFIAIKTILDEGYLKDNDSLELLFHIRQSTVIFGLG
ncbi:E3 ubiquitin-protein ligase TRIM37-like isoform X2 [Toxorhynchites rutilus septentrionalis]|uniref:E3 ubiquitin-protein ligase TRIM37-like isoform X2 n=1 Tax=Toxorhynchites rutilus septentrionalis TaxID=329112 RepID=UPI00247A1C5F|nr:E3 ubiquitin-protein ligase TRIM37-like isoform X2 [Toxorhynchites rutilus septentrionalis]